MPLYREQLRALFSDFLYCGREIYMNIKLDRTMLVNAGQHVKQSMQIMVAAAVLGLMTSAPATAVAGRSASAGRPLTPVPSHRMDSESLQS